MGNPDKICMTHGRGCIRENWIILTPLNCEGIREKTAVWLHKLLWNLLDGRKITIQEYRRLMVEEKVVFVKISGDAVLSGKIVQPEDEEYEQNYLLLKFNVNTSGSNSQVSARDGVQGSKAKTIKLGELRFNDRYKRWELGQSVSPWGLVDSLLQSVQSGLKK